MKNKSCSIIFFRGSAIFKKIVWLIEKTYDDLQKDMNERSVEMERLRNEKHMLEEYLNSANEKIDKMEKTLEFHDKKMEEDLVKRIPKYGYSPQSDAKSADEDALASQLANLTRQITATNKEIHSNFSKLPP